MNGETMGATGMQAEAMTITHFFKQRRIMARITGGYASPAYYVYRLEMGPGAKFDALQNALDDLQRVIYSNRLMLGIIEDGDARARVVVRASPQPLVLEVSRPKRQLLELSAIQWQPEPFKALAGLAFNSRAGQPVVWDLTDPSQPHVLIAGTSGSGKSNLELSLALTLAAGTPPDQLTLYVVDGGNSSLQLLARLAHCASFGGDAETALQIIANVVAIVMDRKRRSDTSGAHRVVLIVDELANLLAVMDRDTAKVLQRDLATVAAEGRKFGVHLMACTQKPLADVTGSLTKSNMAVRMVGAVASWQDAQTAADMPGTGAERLAGHGDFIYRSGMLVQRFQAPLVASPMTSIFAANGQWRGVDASATHAGLAALAADSADDEPTELAPAGVPPALLPVFEQFTTTDGSMRRGGVAAALRALYGNDAPQSGKGYQTAYDRVMAWHSEYFTSLHTTGRTPVLVSREPVMVGSEVKQSGHQVWY